MARKFENYLCCTKKIFQKYLGSCRVLFTHNKKKKKEQSYIKTTASHWLVTFNGLKLT